jgi:DNA-binding transcriptional MocR family regulator
MYRYQSLVSLIHEWVSSGVLKPGDRVPSVREMSTKLGYSAVTVHHAYGVLEDEGILESRPRSGFFVSREARPLPEFTTAALTSVESAEEQEAADLESFLAAAASNADVEGFGSLGLSSDLVPYDELYRLLLSNIRWEGTMREPLPWQGTIELREAVAKRPGVLSTGMSIKDIIVTPGVEPAMELAFQLLTRPGDRVLIETPTDPTTIATALRRNVEIVEIYSHPRSGIDPEQFAYLLQHNQFAACVLATSNHVPTGISYSADVAKRIMQTATERGVPVIENTSGQDLLYGAQAGINLSQFDEHNLVLRVGGFGETLGVRFGLGWIAVPRRHYVRQARHHMGEQHLAGALAIQRTVAEYINRRSYERHLRKLKENLGARMRKGLSVIYQHFPDNCTVSRPTGGYFCWVRAPKEFKSLETGRHAYSHGISVAPGPMFSVTRSFGNFLALNLSHQWTPERETQLAWIGDRLASTDR